MGLSLFDFQNFRARDFVILDTFFNISNLQLLNKSGFGGREKNVLLQKVSVEGNDTCDCHIPGVARVLEHHAGAGIWVLVCILSGASEETKSSRYCGSFESIQMTDVY